MQYFFVLFFLRKKKYIYIYGGKKAYALKHGYDMYMCIHYLQYNIEIKCIYFI